MNYFLGVLGKSFSALTVDEFIALVAILMVCCLFVSYSVSLLLRQVRRIAFSTPEQPSLAKSFKTVGSLRDYRGFTD